jgi:uroporphyrinogen-III synthase
VLPVCLGRSCAEAAGDLGYIRIVQPEAPRLGAMVECLAEHLAGTALRLSLGGTEVVVQGTVALVAGKERWLAERERAVLVELARSPGTVVAKGELLRRVWRADGGEGVDRHAVEVVVARLRRRLGPAGGGLQTVPRRGYRLVLDGAPEVAPPPPPTGSRAG